MTTTDTKKAHPLPWMRSRHVCAVLLEYAVTAGLVYWPVIDVRLIRLLLLAPLVFETNAPLAVYRQSHICTNLLLIKPTAPVIAIYHVLTSIAHIQKDTSFRQCPLPFFHILIISCQDTGIFRYCGELFKKSEYFSKNSSSAVSCSSFLAYSPS